MRRSLYVVIVFLFLVVGSVCVIILGFNSKQVSLFDQWPDEEVIPVKLVSNTTIDSTISLTDDFIKINRGYKHNKEFKKGHVKIRAMERKVSLTDDGFIIDLGRQTQVPTPMVIDDKLFVSGGFGSKQYYCFDAKTGAMIWGVDLDDDGPSAAIYEDGRIIFNTESCTIFALDAKTGEMAWSHWLGDPLMSTPTAANGKVYTAYPAGYNNWANVSGLNLRPTHIIAEIDLASGEIGWQKWIDGDIMTAPVATNGELHFTTFSGTYYKMKQDGEIIHCNASRATSAPVVVGSKVMMSFRSDNDSMVVSEGLATTDGSVSKMMRSKKAIYLDKGVQNHADYKSIAAESDAGNGFGAGAPPTANAAQAADNIGLSNVSSLQAFSGSRSVYSDGKLYNTMGDSIICTDEETGIMLWGRALAGDMTKVGGHLASAPIKVNNMIIVAGIDGTLTIRNEADGSLIKEFKIGEPIRAEPIVHNGWIYVTTTLGKLRAINMNDDSYTGWPMMGQNPAHTNLVN